jgi:hypothetical protein
MKQFAYAQKTENDMQLFLFDKPEPIEPGYDYEALMMSRVDFDIKVTEVPPVHESEMENLLTYKLRSLYPGDPESTAFDYKVLVKNKQRHAVIFITSKETLESYKQVADKKPLFLSFPITNALMQKYDEGDCILFYWHRDWVDISIYEKGIFISSSAIRREKEAFLDFLKMRNMLPPNFKDYRCIVISFSDESEFLKEQSKDFFKDVENAEYLTVEETLPLLSKKSDYLFYKKKKTPIVEMVKIEYLLIAAIVLVCLFVNKIVWDRDAYLKKLNTLFTKENEQAKQNTQYKEKKADLDKILDKKPADTFILLTEAADIFNNEVDVTSIRIETKTETQGKKKTDKVSFTIEARSSSDPLRYIERFNKNKYFADAIITKQDLQKRVFTLTGSFVKGGKNGAE